MMSDQSILTFITACYDSGNELFRQGRFEDADIAYSKGIMHFEEVMTDLENLEYMYVKLLSNRSQSRIFLRDFSGAIADTSKLLVFNPVNLKALFRRATALQCVGRYGEAIEIAEKILLQKLPESLLKSALKLRSDLKSQEQMDMQVQRAEGVPLSFVTDHQVIKLALGSPHIDKVAIGRRYSFKLCLGNEFGLFNKKLLPQDEGPALGIMASLIAIGDDQWHDLPGSSLQLALHKHGTAVFPNSGQVEFTFSLSDNESTDVCMQYVLMRFECTRELSTGKTVVPVLTLPILVAATPAAIELAASIRCRGHLLLTTASQIGAQCIREVAIPQDLMAATERPKVGFLAYECPGYLGIGGKVWDSTYVLFKYLQRNPELIRQKSVFEFGSGTGLAGISLSCLQPQSVYLSDFANITPLLSANVELNKPILNHFCHLSKVSGNDKLVSKNCNYNTVGFCWGDKTYTPSVADTVSNENAHDAGGHNIMDIFGLCDVAVASDVVYDPIGYEPLFTAINHFLNAKPEDSDGRCVIMAHRHRNPEDKSFFNMLDGCANIQYYDVDFDENIPQIDSKDATGNFNGHCTEAAELVTPIGVEDGMAYHRRENSLILGKVRIFMIRSVSLSTTFTS